MAKDVRSDEYLAFSQLGPIELWSLFVIKSGAHGPSEQSGPHVLMHSELH